MISPRISGSPKLVWRPLETVCKKVTCISAMDSPTLTVQIQPPNKLMQIVNADDLNNNASYHFGTGL